MGLFNFFSKSKAKPTPEPTLEVDKVPTYIPEEIIGDTSPHTETTHEREHRQGQKLIAMYYHKPNDIAKVIARGLPANEQIEFYDKIINGDLNTDAARSKLLQKIQPAYGADDAPDYQSIFNKINTLHGLTILNYAGGYGASGNLAQLSAPYLYDFYKKYPTPIEFQSKAASLINDLVNANTAPQTIEQYKTDLEEFQKAVYGKRYEYYQAMQNLINEAAHFSLERYDAEHKVMRLNQARALYEAAAKEPHFSDPRNIPR